MGISSRRITGRTPAFIEALENRRLLSAAGALDSTFGTGGKVTTDLGDPYDRASAVAVQSDGKIVAAGFGEYASVVRYNANGTIDNTFASLSSLAGGYSEFHAVTILSDGKILIAGGGYNSSIGNWDVRVSRLNSNGTFDTTFGTGGTRFLNIGSTDIAHDMALQSDGKIVLTGETFGTSWNAFTARLTADGAIDTTFAGTGYVVTDFGTTNQEWTNGLVIQSDGKILVGGSSDDGSKTHMALARFNTDGTYDTSLFGGTGIYVVPVVSTFGGEDIQDMVLLPDGKILTGGVGGTANFMLARFNTNGSLDTTFATSGRKTLNVGPSNNRIQSLIVRPDGRIIAGGWRTNTATGNFDWALVEFMSDGTPASDFGTNGIVTTDFGTNFDQGAALMRTSSGIVMVGQAGTANVSDDFAVARYIDTPLYGSITGTLFSDDNGNGVQDSGEGSFSSGTAFIDSNNNGVYDTGEPLGATPVASVFSFANLLPGTYAIRMRYNNSQNSYTVTTPALNVTVAEGQQITNAGPIGVYTVYNVSGQAFADLDGNGLLNGADTLLADRTIYVDTNDNGKLDTGEQSAVTDSKGAWTLNLPKGNYRLRQVIPIGWSETGRSLSFTITGSTFAADGMARIPTDLGPQSQTFRFGSQQTPLAHISGYVVHDTNGNGVVDTGESSTTSGDVVYIDGNNNGSLDSGETSFTTGTSGWSFDVQPGTYVIRQQLPSGWKQTSPLNNVGFTITVASGNYGPLNFLRFLPKASISGTVFKDIDRDGIWDSDEVGVGSQDVYIDSNNDGVYDGAELDVQTDVRGNWMFNGLDAGTYVVRLIPPYGWSQSAPTSNGAITITVGAGEARSGYAFGDIDYRPGLVGGYVFNDANNNGVRDAGETGIPNVFVYYDANRNGQLDPVPSNDETVATDANGHWSISLQEYNRLTYRVAFYNQTGRALTTPALGYYETAPIAGQTVNGYDFGLRVAPVGGSISGTVYNDANNNAKRDSGESGVAGVTVYNDANNNSKMDVGEMFTTTDTNGLYTLNGLSSGSYKIRQILQNGWTQTTPANNYGLTITLATNQVLSGKDFGTKQGTVSGGGFISGNIWYDADGDGVNDGGVDEVGYPDVTVYNDANNNSKLDTGELKTVTDVDGNYSFSNLAAGSYKIRQVPPPGMSQTTPANNYGWTITLAANQTLSGKNFGLMKTINPPGVGTVSGTVYIDSNGDGFLDSGETRLGGHTVFVDENENLKLDPTDPSATTDSQGNYTINNVPAGYLNVYDPTQPTGLEASAPVLGFQAILMPTDGGNFTGIDFGFAPPNVTISGVVYLDANNNAKQDTGEAGVPNVRVYLDANNNGALDSGELSMLTASDGTYQFGPLRGGDFYIREIVPNGYVQTAPASNGAVYFRISHGSSGTANFGIATAPIAGGSIAGTVWNDLDGDRVKDSNELGVASITIYNDANNNSKLDSGEKTTVTDASGNYVLSGLSSGSYKIREILQSGWSQTTPANNYGWTLTLATNQQLTGKNFGTKQSTVAQPAGKIGGRIFNDLDGDGVKDSNEIGVGAGWMVYIDLDNDSILDSNEVFTTTDANGNWTLSGLAAGTYKVRQVLQSGWKQTTPTNNYGLNVTLSTNQSVTGKLFGSKRIA